MQFLSKKLKSIQLIESCFKTNELRLRNSVKLLQKISFVACLSYIIVTLLRMGGKKDTPTSFSLVASTNASLKLLNLNQPHP